MDFVDRMSSNNIINNGTMSDDQGCAGVMNAESGIYGKIVMNSVVFRNNTTLANTDSGISKSKSKCI